MTASTATARMEQISLNLIAPDAHQVRKHFDEAAIQELGESLKQNGMIQPIVVRPRMNLDASNAGTMDYDYTIIAGERRWRAAQQAGLTSVPVIVREDLKQADISILQILENMQRENLSLAETCAGVSALVEQIGFADTVKKLGKSEGWVSKHASLAKLPEPIRNFVTNGKIQSIDIAKDLAQLHEINVEEAEEFYRNLDPLYGLSQEEIEEQQEYDRNLAEKDPERAARSQLYEEQRAHITRAEVRGALADAKEWQQRQAEHAAQRTQERSEGPDRNKISESDWQAKSRAAQKAGEESATFADAMTIKLHERAGLPVPTRENEWCWSDNVVIHVNRRHYFGGDGEPPPESPECAEYQVDVGGTLDQVTHALKLLPAKAARAEIEGEITVDEARKIAEILGDRFTIDYRVTVPGTKLKASAEPPEKRTAKNKAKPKSKTKAEPASNESNSVDAFLKACVKPATIPVRRIKSTVLHQHYLTWCKGQGITNPISSRDNRWGQAIEAAGIEKIRSNGFHYVGIEVTV